jgi:hypothetical protein
MICLKCKTRNPIGNKFCKECGTALPLDANPLVVEETNRVEQERKQEQVAGLLAQAFGLSENNQVEKALPLVQEAILLMPNSTAAHSLLATLYERLDEPEKAISAMKRVVELNPESAADRNKLEMMQRGVHVLPKATPQAKPNSSSLPLALACVMVASVLTGGMFLMNTTSSKNSNSIEAAVPEKKKTPPLALATDNTPVRVATNIGSPGIGAAVATKPLTTMTLEPPASRTDPFAPLNPPASPIPQANLTNLTNLTTNNMSLPPVNQNRLAPRSRRKAESSRPKNIQNTQKERSEPPSVVIVPPSAALSNPANAEGTTPMGRVGRPSNVEPSNSAVAPPAPPKKEEDKGYIRIQVRPMTAAERAQEERRLEREREKERSKGENGENNNEEGTE